MSLRSAAEKVTAIKLAALAVCLIGGIIAVTWLPTAYLYLLLFAAGVGAFCMIGYQLLGMMREEPPEVVKTTARPIKSVRAPILAARLPADDLIILDWARERLEAGNTLDAGSRLERISSAHRNHPEVLQLRHEIYFAERRWHAALDAARAWATAAPDEPLAWEAQAACLGELRQYQEAFELLAPVAARHPQTPALAYRMARLCAEIGRLEESQRWLFKALDAGDKPALVRRAMADAALEPLLHFLGRRVLVERIITDGAEDDASRATLEFAQRHGIERSKPDKDAATVQADGLVLFAVKGDLGGAAVPRLDQARHSGLPFLLLQRDDVEADAVGQFLLFLEKHRIRTLQVAGSATAESGLADFASDTLEAAFDYQLRSHLRGTATPASLRG
jgi:tetratricopeptide (TPR) repeat protein